MIPRRIDCIVLVLICAALVVSGQPRRRQPQWFYTGRLIRDSIADRVFPGSEVNLWRLPNDHSLTLLYGGILANFSSFDVNLIETVRNYVHQFLNASQPSDLHVGVARHYILVGTIDYKQALGLQTGLYDFETDEMTEFSEVPARYGALSLLIVEERNSQESAEPHAKLDPEPGFEGSVNAETDAMCRRVHAMALSVDQRNRPSPLQYTFLDASDSNDASCKVLSERLLQRLEAKAELQDPNSANTNKEAIAAADKATISLRVMTYNMWHTNPAAWAVQFFEARWERYWRRINFLVDLILDEDPDVIFLQEVRWDGGFDPHTTRTPMHEYFAKYSGDAQGAAELDCMRGGSQLTHVVCMLELKSAKRASGASKTASSPEIEGTCGARSTDSDVCEDKGDSEGSAPGNRKTDRIYEFAFQPAMSMHSTERMWIRGEEEGVAIIVKRRSNSQNHVALNIASIDHMLLPRTLDDKTDDHQRVLLHVAVDMHVSADKDHYNSGVNEKIHFYSIHLSLNERARNDSYIAMSLKMEKDGGYLQILGGDLNAEPHESGVRDLLLVEDSLYQRIDRGGAADGGDQLAGAGSGTCVASGAIGSPGESSLIAVEALPDGEVQLPSSDAVASERVARGFLRDMWRQSRVHGWHPLSKSQRIAVESDSDDRSDRRDDLGLTFPTCDPKKRIDYLLYREPESPCGTSNNISCGGACAINNHRVQSVEVYAIGGDATPDTAHLYREGVGMLDRDSPLWASDHLGLVANIDIAV